MIVTQRLSAFQPDDIAVAGAILRRGGVVAIPTETVYGLATAADNAVAVERIFAAKGRPSDNPLIVHIADIQALETLCRDVPDEAFLLASRFWPGPLTLVLPKKDTVPDVVTAGLPTVAVRLPASPEARAVITAAGVPLAAPSANRAGRPSPTCADHVWADMNGRIDAVLDGGACCLGVESTVLDLTSQIPRLLRPGGVTHEELEAALGVVVAVDPAVLGLLPPGEKPRAPGMKYRHYAPEAPVVILSGDAKAAAAYVQKNNAKGTAVLCAEEEKSIFPDVLVVCYGRESEPKSLARGLFDALRQLDDPEIQIIYARRPAAGGLMDAVRNRLGKAASFQILDV